MRAAPSSADTTAAGCPASRIDWMPIQIRYPAPSVFTTLNARGRRRENRRQPERRCGRVNDTAGANAGDRQHRATTPDRENVARHERHVRARQNGQKRRDTDERVQPRINAHGPHRSRRRGARTVAAAR